MPVARDERVLVRMFGKETCKASERFSFRRSAQVAAFVSSVSFWLILRRYMEFENAIAKAESRPLRRCEMRYRAMRNGGDTLVLALRPTLPGLQVSLANSSRTHLPIVLHGISMPPRRSRHHERTRQTVHVRFI